jgi:glycosyltransferase involved in cell wall biosynthesis
MAEALANRGHDIHVVTYHFGDAIDGIDFEIHRIPAVLRYQRVSPGPTLRKLLVLDPMVAAKLVRVLDEGSFDVIHGHHYEGLLVGLFAARASGLPVVYDAHTLLQTELPAYPLGIPEVLMVDHGGVPVDRATVVPSGIEPEQFQVPQDRIPLLDSSTKHLIFTGNLAPYQGVEQLLRSFKLAFEQRPDLRLLIVTEDSFAPYDALARELAIRDAIEIECVGFKDVPALLAAADVALNPRLRCDGTPQKLLNYMAAGKPIVSFAGSGHVLEHDRTGLLVPDDSVESFSAAILRVLDDNDLATSLGAAARSAANREYGWDRTARGIETIYEQVTSRRSRRYAGILR